MPACRFTLIFPVASRLSMNPVPPASLPDLSRSLSDLSLPILIVIEGIIVLAMALLVIRSWWLRRQDPDQPGK